ncbi:MAG TPA: hypothetical protein VF796_13740 [Humisphaera sp.]
MGLFEAKGQLDRGWKDLMIRWNMTRASWRDNAAAEFEEQNLIPLQANLRNAVSAMTTAAGFISRVRSECSDRE